MDELDALIKQILGLPNVKPEDIQGRLKALAHAQLYQPIFNAGYNTATAKADTDRQALQTRVDKAEADLAEAQKKLKKLTDETPDVAKLDAQYQKQIEDLNKQIAKLQDDHKAEKVNAAIDSAESRVTGLLNARVVPEHVPALLNKQNRARITAVLGEDGKPVVRVLQKGQQIPFAGTEDEQLAAFANELIEGVNTLFLRSDVDKGSGRDNSAGGSTKLSKKEQFEQVRKKARGETTDPANAPPPLRDQLAGRLGMRVS